MNAPIATCAMTHPTGIVPPHLKHTTSPTAVTHATIPQTVAGLTSGTLMGTTADEECQATPEIFNPL